MSSVLASSLWLNERVNFIQKTLDTLAEDYYASSYRGTMAKCECCGQEMLTANGCTFTLVGNRKKKYRREKVGDEGWTKPGERCGGCGALYGYYHHPNCDIERCPICGGQLISCDCDITNYYGPGK